MLVVEAVQRSTAQVDLVTLLALRDLAVAVPGQGQALADLQLVAMPERHLQVVEVEAELLKGLEGLAALEL
jgi:hypothetical protein